MRTETNIRSTTEDTEPVFFIESSGEDENNLGEWKTLDEMSGEEKAQVGAALLADPAKLLSAMASLVTDLRDAVDEDLSHIWAKVDN